MRTIIFNLLAALMLIASVAGNENNICGEWVFHSVGNPGRLFRFCEDGSWTGRSEDGSIIVSGQWEVEEPRLFRLSSGSREVSVVLDPTTGVLSWLSADGMSVVAEGRRPEASPVVVEL